MGRPLKPESADPWVNEARESRRRHHWRHKHGTEPPPVKRPETERKHPRKLKVSQVKHTWTIEAIPAHVFFGTEKAMMRHLQQLAQATILPEDR